MKLKYKIWLDNEGKAFGEGPYKILKSIQKHKSLNKASKEIKISYTKAWTIIRMTESRLGFKLVNKEVGGINGGGSFVTPEGKRLLETYEVFSKEADACLREFFEKHFAPMFDKETGRDK